ncbi:MAG: branched-chain amino acid aminotransferase [Bacteroidetes bacterium]|nr:branched-chain amino acid aminotransferase [Bacteroidota bacterium]
MTAALDILLTRSLHSRLSDLDLDNIPFGKHYTDHMLEVDFLDGQWRQPVIKPYQHLSLAPSMAALHYGQAIFEGIKAYVDADGNPRIFRPLDNFYRFNISAERMQMPVVPEDIFMEGMKQLVSLDRAWIPNKKDHSLYIRPFMFSTDELIGVRPSDNYKFLIILSPSGPYYSAPMRIHVEEQYIRAAPGGVGYAKAAGNYGAAMYATAQARKHGYDQVLWMDGLERKYVQECGTMNVFFIIGDTAITPSLEQGTILNGVTRQSVITLLQEAHLRVEERPLSLDEIVEAYDQGTLKEVFGTGTAATISLIKELACRERELTFEVEKWQYAPAIKQKLMDIRAGRIPDLHGWMMPVG